MVNVPALAGALQYAKAAVWKDESVALMRSISTCPFGSPPLQVTVIPLERVTARLFGLSGLTRVGDGGIAIVALKGLTAFSHRNGQTERGEEPIIDR
jgi:hypothetical protein